MLTLAIAAIIIGLALATEQYFDTVRTHREWAANDASFWRLISLLFFSSFKGAIMLYVIHKTSRMPGAVSYNGPTCKTAGVIGGRVYNNIEEATRDARKLSECNPVGFIVSPINT